MEVVYQSEWATIVHGDAFDALDALATESVDLILTDPPYGVEWQSGRRADTFDFLANDDHAGRDGVGVIIGQCVRVVGQDRHLYVFGPDDVLAGLKVSEVVELIWDKQRTCVTPPRSRSACSAR
jgi:site-specific DNA-methyltransferase (adenine-specific)